MSRTDPRKTVLTPRNQDWKPMTDNSKPIVDRHESVLCASLGGTVIATFSGDVPCTKWLSDRWSNWPSALVIQKHRLDRETPPSNETEKFSKEWHGEDA